METTNKDLRKWTSLLAVTLLVATVASVVRAQDPSLLGIQSYGVIEYPSIPKITISGTDFIANGEPCMFRGVNVQFTGLHHPESGCQSISRTTFQLYKGWNVNLLRVWLNMEMASPSYGVWDQDFFDDLELVLDLSEEYEMYVFISGLHSYGLAPKFDGTGLPDWMFSGISSINAGMDMLYKAIVQENPTYQNVRNAIREYYHRIANICKDRNIVMGYDIFNEPPYRNILGYSKISASYFYESLSEYITEIDPDKPQAVEGNFIDDNYKPNIPNLFDAPHGYARHTYDYSLSEMKSMFTRDGYWVHRSRWNIPMLNGEWFLGTQSEAQSYGLTVAEIAQWYDTYITAMEELDIGWVVLRCEATPSRLHWSGDLVKDVLLNHWALNTLP